MAFNVALSGLTAAQTDLEVTGHNIANASTAGFKQSRAEFADMFSTALQDVGSVSSGAGVRVNRIAQQFGQGSIDFTANSLDLGINGDGFFVLQDGSGNFSYSRSGAFSVDRDGSVVNAQNETLQIYEPIDTTGTRFNTGSTADLQLPTSSGNPNATTEINTSINLDAGETTPATVFSPGSPTTYNHSTSTTVYDSLGVAHTQTMYFRKEAANDWRVYTYIDGTNAPVGGNPYASLTFSTSGGVNLSSGDVSALGMVTLDSFALGNGASPLSIDYDFNLLTQYGSDFSVIDLTQDGYTAGQLSGIDIDNTGVVFARFTNGQSTSLGKVALARFNNPTGLRQLGDTSWTNTFASGDVQYGEAGTSNFGLIQSGALESSNVDTAEQLVKLITAQRNFQANAQVISTADTVTQTIINIR